MNMIEIPVHPRLIRGASLFAIGLVLPAALLGLARELQVSTSTDALRLLPALAVGMFGLGWMVCGSKIREAGGVLSAVWTVLLAVVGVGGLAFVDIALGWIPHEGEGWTTAMLPALLASTPFVALGALASRLANESRAEDVLLSLAVGAAASCAVATGILASATSFGGQAGLRWMVLSGTALAVLIAFLRGRANEVEEDRAPSHGKLSWWIALSVGLALSSVARQLTLPVHSNIAAWPYALALPLIGLAIGALICVILGAFRLRLRAWLGVVAAVLGGAALVAVLIARSLGEIGDFDRWLNLAGGGATTTSYLLASFLPGWPISIITLALALALSLDPPSKAKWGALALCGTGAFLLGWWLQLALGWHGATTSTLAGLLAMVPSISMIFSRDLSIGKMPRLLTAVASMGVWVVGFLLGAAHFKGDATWFRAEQPGMAGDVVLAEDGVGQHLFLEAYRLPGVATSHRRMALAAAAHRLYTHEDGRALVIETVALDAANALAGMGPEAVAVLDLVHPQGTSKRAARKRLEPIPDESLELIVQEPLDPRRPESGGLLTYEHFSLIASKLTETGAAMVYLPMERMRWETMGLVARAFARAFDTTSVWMTDPLGDEPVIGLLGRGFGQRIDWSRYRAWFDQNPRKAAFTEYFDNPIEVLDHYVGDQLFIGERFAGTEIATDEAFLLEARGLERFEADVFVGLSSMPLLLKAKDSLVGRVEFPGLQPREEADWEQLIQRSSHGTSYAALARTLLLRAAAVRATPVGSDRTPDQLEKDAVRKLGEGYSIAPNHRLVTKVVVELGRSLILRGRLEEVAEYSRNFATLCEASSILNLQAMALIGLSKDQEAIAVLDRALELDPSKAEYRSNRAFARLFSGDSKAALDDLNEVREQQGGLTVLAETLWVYLQGDRAQARARLAQIPTNPLIGQRLAAWIEKDSKS